MSNMTESPRNESDSSFEMSSSTEFPTGLLSNLLTKTASDNSDSVLSFLPDSAVVESPFLDENLEDEDEEILSRFKRVNFATTNEKTFGNKHRGHSHIFPVQEVYKTSKSNNNNKITSVDKVGVTDDNVECEEKIESETQVRFMENEDNQVVPRSMSEESVVTLKDETTATENENIVKKVDNKISLKMFNKHVDARLELLVDLIEKQANLSISGHSVVELKNVNSVASSKSSITNTGDHVQATVVFYVPDLPKANPSFWRPTLCLSMAEHLESQLCKISGIKSLKPVDTTSTKTNDSVEYDAVRIQSTILPTIEDLFLYVDVKFAPKF